MKKPGVKKNAFKPYFPWIESLQITSGIQQKELVSNENGDILPVV